MDVRYVLSTGITAETRRVGIDRGLRLNLTPPPTLTLTLILTLGTLLSRCITMVSAWVGTSSGQGGVTYRKYIAPTSAPTVTPSPTPLPSPLPSPLPTLQPTPVPTPLPTGLPSILPVPVPSSQPSTPRPSTPSPSPAPTPSPSPPPTASPSLSPTADDYVAVSVELTVAGLNASRVTESDIEAIKTGVAKCIDGVNASDVCCVMVTDASSSSSGNRRRQRRRLEASTGSAVVAFEVAVSISDSTYDDSEAFSDAVSESVTDASNDGTLVEAIQDDGSNTFSSASVVSTSVSVATRQPSPLPTPGPSLTTQPSASPSASPTAPKDDDGEAAGDDGVRAAGAGSGCDFGGSLMDCVATVGLIPSFAVGTVLLVVLCAGGWKLGVCCSEDSRGSREGRGKHGRHRKHQQANRGALDEAAHMRTAAEVDRSAFELTNPMRRAQADGNRDENEDGIGMIFCGSAGAGADGLFCDAAGEPAP